MSSCSATRTSPRTRSSNVSGRSPSCGRSRARAGTVRRATSLSKAQPGRSAGGRLRLCLFGDHEIDLRTPLRAGAGREEIVNIFRDAMFIKPERHHLKLGEVSSQMRAFSEIGG